MTESNLAAARRVHAQLAERWPALFDEKKPVPLAIGISDALLEAMPDATAAPLRRALGGWCKCPRYLAALVAGADRHGLEGVQGTVTEEQAADAAERFKAIQAAFRENDEAKRQANIARLANARKKAEKAEAQKAKQAEQPPAPPKPAAAAPKPAGPVIIVKKRRIAQPATD
jgi:sRNA-binding protein